MRRAPNKQKLTSRRDTEKQKLDGVLNYLMVGPPSCIHQVCRLMNVKKKHMENMWHPNEVKKKNMEKTRHLQPLVANAGAAAAAAALAIATCRSIPSTTMTFFAISSALSMRLIVRKIRTASR